MNKGLDLRGHFRSVIYLLLFFLMLQHNVIGAQGTINAPTRECLGNVTSFSYTPPSGLTLASASWNFGDGFTSSSTTPVHTYGSTGIYNVVIQATFTNSSTSTDSVKIEILGLPKAYLYYDPTSDSCFNHNQVCYVDTSRPAIPGQTITNRLFVWGDGTFDQKSNPGFGQRLCYTYSIPDVYYLRMELTDKYGCKSSISKTINIVENIDADFEFDTTFYDCDEIQICMRNKSIGANPKTEHYKWYVDNILVDTLPYYSSKKCVRFKNSSKGNVILVANANNNCIDTMVIPYGVYIDAMPDSLYVSDSVWCYGSSDGHSTWFKNVARDTVKWHLDGFYDATLFGAEIGIWTYKPMPGKHTIKAEIIRGIACPIQIDFRVIGPAAAIKIIDDNQCLSSNEVFLIDNSYGIRRENCTFNWRIFDPFGDNLCVNNRIKDVNKYKNCNRSIDWWTRHQFKRRLYTKYNVMLTVHDTVSGCIDATTNIVDMDNCCSLLFLDSVNVCRDGYFYNDFKGPPPYEFTIDSATQTWYKFAGHIDSSLTGMLDVGLKFRTQLSPWVEKIGDDSIKVRTDTLTYYDTVYFKDYIHIKEKKTDSVYVTVYGLCKPPYRVSVHFENGMFYKGDSLFVGWGGQGDSADFEMRFTDSMRIDSIHQTFNFTGLQTDIKVSMENIYGCRHTYEIPLKKGKLNSKDYLRNRCLGDVTCFTPYVYQVDKTAFWTGNTAYNYVSWWFDDTGEVKQFNPCYKFKAGGKHIIEMRVRDSLGCQDTLVDSVFVQDLRANVKANSKILYCSELKQFFDSSYYIPNRGDSIKRYSWQFGSGIFSSITKDPLQSLNTSLEKIKASHAIESKYGCFDTIDFEITVIGPKPYFRIKDTIGCGSLNAEFINLSKNCKQFIWEYGDSLKTTYQTFSKTNVNFLYNKPGRYYISLVGIDTVFNPFTNRYQNCVSRFPDTLFQKDTTRSVLVIPLYKTGINSKDTICLGTSLSLQSLSDTAYDYDQWHMGDTSGAFKLNPGSAHNYLYKKPGLYNIKLSPGYNISSQNICRDSAIKSIFVMDINADFDIDPNNVPPVFLFHNKSRPAGATLKWDFGQPGSGSSNSSGDNDPSHNYDKDTGTFNVCLIITTTYGCVDTVCKPVFNDHMEEFGIYNVFTPGLKDNKNDQYDIEIENESLYELLIYDRWGNLVYEGKEDADNTQNVNWNGKVFNKGAECPSGTYYYIFRYSLKQTPGDIKTINGVIVLIR
jgi:gliding motility-associated-like protein